jgi:hypothetical protein
VNFELVWQPDTLTTLQILLEQNPEREERLIELIRRADRNLSEDPYSWSESRGGNPRIYVDLPMVLWIVVFFRQRQVMIADVRLCGEL